MSNIYEDFPMTSSQRNQHIMMSVTHFWGQINIISPSSLATSLKYTLHITMLVTPSFYLQICLHKHYFHFYFKQWHNIHIANLANLFTNNHTMAKSSTRKASKTSGNKSVASPVAGKKSLCLTLLLHLLLVQHLFHLW